MSDLHPVLIAGAWRPALTPVSDFAAANPANGETLSDRFPVSGASDIDAALDAAASAAPKLRAQSPESVAAFLNAYADAIEANRETLVASAHAETGLAAEPRLNSVELPRTTNQLRLAAAAAIERSWTHPVIDTKAGIRSQLEPLPGAALVFGPNNFPFAFNAISGGDFAAAIAARLPVIAILHPSHPKTSLLLAQLAQTAADECGLPAGSVQALYKIDPADGLKMIAHPAVAAVAFTGSRVSGLKLKEAADKYGKPAFLEMSSVNPIFVLDGAIDERVDALAAEFFTSCTMASGQFCTNPGLVIVSDGASGGAFIDAATQKFAAGAPGVLLNSSGRDHLAQSVATLKEAGANVVAGGAIGPEPGFRFQPTLLTVSGDAFLNDPHTLQTEAFGPVSLIVTAHDDDQMLAIAHALDGNLTGAIYSHTSGADDSVYDRIAPILRTKVGRLLNDKMPTGVAVSPAMNHGGPFPATGNPHFTSVGIPGSITRFGQLASYDAVRSHRLPLELQDHNPLGIWRLTDGEWTR